MKVKRARAVGLFGVFVGFAVGWHEGWGSSLASWTSAVLVFVSIGMLCETLPSDDHAPN